MDSDECLPSFLISPQCTYPGAFMRIPLVPSIPALLLVCAFATPGQAAVSISSDDGLVMNFGLDVQAQETMANAKSSTGGDYDIIDARPGLSDQMDIQNRRARFFTYGTYDANWKYFLGFLNDHADNEGASTSSASSGRNTQLYKAYIERDLPSDALVSTLHAGLDYPFYNIAIQGDPNWLFCNQRATGTLSNIREEGLRYKLSGSKFTWGVDVMDSLAEKPAGSAAQRAGLFYSSRLEFYPLPGKKPAYKESYAGAPGTSLMVAADVGYDDHDLGLYNGAVGTPAGSLYRTNSLGYGFESIYHMDGLTALGEFRQLNTTANSLNTPSNPTLRNRAQIFLIQAGYTIPVAGIGIEPAVRFTKMNYGLATAIASNYDETAQSLPSGANNNVFGLSGGDADSGLTGRQIDAGVNFYFVKHMIEMQVDYSYWDAAYGQAKANILRVQEQIAF